MSSDPKTIADELERSMGARRERMSFDMTRTFSLDSSAFEAGMLRVIQRAMPEAVRRALSEAAGQCLNDAINKNPKVPLRQGTLRGSGTWHVNGKLQGIAPNIGGEPTPMTEPTGETIGSSEFLATIGFNTPYAAHLHEHPEFEFKQTDPTTGGKYLESKLVTYGRDYVRIVAEKLRNAS